MPSAVFSQWKLCLSPTDFLRIHDFIGFAMLQNTILMNAGSVRERVLPDDRFASCDGQSAHPADNSRSLYYLRELKLGEVFAIEILSSLDCHDDFLQSNITSSLADAVDGSFHLPGTGADCGQRIGYGEPQVIVAMYANDRVINISDVVLQILNDRSELLRYGIANRIRNIHRGSAGFDSCLDDLGQKLRLSA